MLKKAQQKGRRYMQLNLNCILCNLKQVLTVTDFAGLDDCRKELVMREVLEYLQATSYKRSNPEVIRGTWEIITRQLGDTDPYAAIKRAYNEKMLSLTPAIQNVIDQAADGFFAALKIAITGNLIDFVARQSLDEKLLLEKISTAEEQRLAVDDSKKLYEKLKTAATLLYLGDNCGEIVIDKLFIEQIKRDFPSLQISYGVRGQAIVNDVTAEDALQVGMGEVAEIISNGDGSLGTVVAKTSAAFQQAFYAADVIIAKGQGNYESLSEIDRDAIYFLFMAKCEPVAKALGVNKLSIVCREYQRNV